MTPQTTLTFLLPNELFGRKKTDESHSHSGPVFVIHFVPPFEINSPTNEGTEVALLTLNWQCSWCKPHRRNHSTCLAGPFARDIMFGIYVKFRGHGNWPRCITIDPITQNLPEILKRYVLPWPLFLIYLYAGSLNLFEQPWHHLQLDEAVAPFDLDVQLEHPLSFFIELHTWYPKHPL